VGNRHDPCFPRPRVSVPAEGAGGRRPMLRSAVAATTAAIVHRARRASRSVRP